MRHAWMIVWLLAGCSDYGFGKDPNRHDPTDTDVDTDHADTGESRPDTADTFDSAIDETGDTDTDADSDSDTDADTDADSDSDTDIDTGSLYIPQDACEYAVQIDGYLDQFETAGDGRVLYCHSGSGHNYNLVESSVDSCIPHLAHIFDIFPTTLCGS